MKLLQLINKMTLYIYVNAVIDHAVKQTNCRNIYPTARHSSEHVAICLYVAIYVNEPFHLVFER